MAMVLQLFVAADLAAMLAGTTRKVASGVNRSVGPAMVQGLSGQRAFSGTFDFDAIPNDAQRLKFLEQNFGQKLDPKLTALEVNRALGSFSYKNIVDVMNDAEQLQAQQGLSKMSKVIFYDTLADFVFSSKISRNVELAEKKGVMISPIDKRVAIHEAGHVLVELYFSSGFIIPVVSAQSRERVAGVTAKILAYSNKPYIQKHLIYSIMMAVAGITAEQVFGIGYAPKMLTNKAEIFNFLQHSTAAGDIQAVHELLQQLKDQENPTTQEIEDLIVRCYQDVYRFFTQHKQEVEELAQQLEKDGSVYEQDIYKNKSRPLFDFEQGPLPQEHALHYIHRGQGFTYGFDDQGNYVGESGIRDQFGNLEELD